MLFREIQKQEESRSEKFSFMGHQGKTILGFWVFRQALCQTNEPT